MSADKPFRISVLVFLRSKDDRFLLIERRKAPNKGCWSPIGGKLEMTIGESPFECAIREVAEEAEHPITLEDLHLFGTISEKSYEGTGHWLMFLFDCHKRLEQLPNSIDEGRFGFFAREEVDALALPETDRTLLWPFYDKNRDGFVVLRADCDPAGELKLVVEQTMPGPGG